MRLAAKSKSSAQMNKSPDGGKTTKKRETGNQGRSANERVVDRGLTLPRINQGQERRGEWKCPTF
jgi:hypothetical protein